MSEDKKTTVTTVVSKMHPMTLCYVVFAAAMTGVQYIDGGPRAALVCVAGFAALPILVYVLF